MKATIKNPGYQSCHPPFVRGCENYLYTQDGREYIDFKMGAGTLVFGHAPAYVRDVLNQHGKEGTLFLQNNPYVQELSSLLLERIPSQLCHHIYCNTGSEATQRAIRLARAATGKEKIASFQGGWHGMNEWTLLDDGDRFSERVIPYTGIPHDILKYSLLLPYHVEQTWEELDRHHQDLAAVIVEPLQGSNPQPHIQKFLQQLRDYCTQQGILLIFDEIITGFRIHPGGASSYFSVLPDIATYGKILGGGLPIGLVAFCDQVHAQSFEIPSKKMLTGGTFSANPLSAHCALETLKRLTDDVYQQLHLNSQFFRDSLNQKLEQEGLPFHLDGVESLLRLYFCKQKIRNRAQRDRLEIPREKQRAFIQDLFQKGILWPENGILCLSTPQTPEFLSPLIPLLLDSLAKLSV